MFGPMKPIPKDEYMQIYQSTGIDIDGRQEMIKHMIPCIEKAIKRFIAFAKALPGFKDLPIDDQIALIKGISLLYKPPWNLDHPQKLKNKITRVSPKWHLYLQMKPAKKRQSQKKGHTLAVPCMILIVRFRCT